MKCKIIKVLKIFGKIVEIDFEYVSWGDLFVLYFVEELEWRLIFVRVVVNEYMEWNLDD